MKKVISLLLTMMLILGLSIPAYAADNEITTQNGSATADVTATYEAGSGGTTIYKVDISWGNLDFTYKDKSVPVWDPDTHTYVGEEHPAYWEGEATITVTNHSNTHLSVTPVYTQNAGYENVDMDFQYAPMYVCTAETGNAESSSMTVIPTGVLSSSAKDTVIGSITLTIADYVAPEMSLSEYMNYFTAEGSHSEIVYVAHPEVPQTIAQEFKDLVGAGSAAFNTYKDTSSVADLAKLQTAYAKVVAISAYIEANYNC